jgi:hypothetical protein
MGAARRHARLVGDAHHQRPHAPHLLFEEADGVGEVGAAQAVRAHELGEEVVVLGRRAARRLLLDQAHAQAALGELIRALAPREAGSDHAHVVHGHAQSSPVPVASRGRDSPPNSSGVSSRV